MRSGLVTQSGRLDLPGPAWPGGVRAAGGVESGFVVVVCRACEGPPCARVCPTRALELRKGGGVKLVEDRCIGCGNCVEACITGAVFWDGEANKPMICVHCGYCAGYCPHGVLGLRERAPQEAPR
mgnify:CR=1 FL=1